MIRRHRVKEVYDLAMYCNECGKRMGPGQYIQPKTAMEPATYRYSCPCGYSVTYPIALPQQQIVMDLTEYDVVDMDNLLVGKVPGEMDHSKTIKVTVEELEDVEDDKKSQDINESTD